MGFWLKRNSSSGSGCWWVVGGREFRRETGGARESRLKRERVRWWLLLLVLGRPFGAVVGRS